MDIEKTKKLFEWIETIDKNRLYSLADMKELLEICMAEMAERNDKSFECLPGSVIDEIIEISKTTGEFYYLEEKIARFKARFEPLKL
jgi:hypothetical protein